MEIVSANALISINETFFVQLISFLVFLFILNRVMIRPLISTMQQRDEHLTDVSSEIEKARLKLENVNRELDHQRAEVLKGAHAAVHALDAEADQRAARLVQEAQTHIVQLRNETEAAIGQQMKKARTQLTGEVDALTTTIMEKVLQRSL
jgi:F-type H+-transporting ATPase subunit b